MGIETSRGGSRTDCAHLFDSGIGGMKIHIIDDDIDGT